MCDGRRRMQRARTGCLPERCRAHLRGSRVRLRPNRTRVRGLVPLDVDLDLHALVALPAIAAQPIALLLQGLALRASSPRLAAWGIVAGLLGVVGTVGVVVLVNSPRFGGAMERLALWPPLIWLGALGWTILRSRRPAIDDLGRADARSPA